MSNSTVEFWSVDGQSLQTLGFNISTVGGDRLAPPELRGADITIPHRAGSRWMPKVIDSRTITLGMWVIGADENGGLSGADQAAFDKNFRKLRKLLWQPTRQFTLTKSFFVDGVLKTASARAQFAGGLNPTMNGRTRAVFTVDLFLADPFFYGDEVTTYLTTGTKEVTVEGDANTQSVRFVFSGSRSNPKVRNVDLDVDFEYPAPIDSGGDLEVSSNEWTAVLTPNGAAAYSVAGTIRHSGAPAWMLLRPGNNSMTLSSDSGSGLVSMIHKPVWL